MGVGSGWVRVGGKGRFSILIIVYKFLVWLKYLDYLLVLVMVLKVFVKIKI